MNLESVVQSLRAEILAGRIKREDFYQIWKSKVGCAKHVERERFKRRDTGLWRAMQCIMCGEKTSSFTKPKGPVPSRIELWDDSIQARIYASHNELWKLFAAKENSDFQHAYEAALRSPHWQMLRQKVGARCNGVCEGCGVRPAKHLHHNTYERLGREMLFDVHFICEQCHQIIHPHRQLAIR